MRVVRNKKYLFLVLISVVILCIFLIYKNNSDNKTKLEQVKLSNEESVLSKDLFAIMISDEDGNYSESTSNIFPSEGYTYNEELSSCIDINGKIVNDILTYDTTNNLVTVSTDTTVYCYLYFDIEKYDFGEYLISKNSNINNLSDNIQGGMYRYQGTSAEVIDNYVCFGTSSKEDCLNNTNTYMYRVIGVNNSGLVYVIKNTSIGKIQWHSGTSNITWAESELNASLNESLFLTNSTYVPSGWEDKIVSTTWKYGDSSIATFQTITTDDLYATVNGWTTSVNAKIGLMYAHDYSYSYKEDIMSCLGASTYQSCDESWMANSSSEWTISECCYWSTNPISNQVWMNNGGSFFINSASTYEYAVRPVFYLDSNAKYVSGNGLSSDPFIIS